MQRAILVATLTAIFGCDTQTPEELCARFGLVPDLARDACRCPDGTTRSEDDTGCLLPDGGFLPFPDASVPDSSTRDGGAPDVGTDRDTGPDCTVMPFYRDRDGDGFGSMLDRVEACEAPSGYVSTSNDCDDECAECRPGGTEACDGVRDEDCDGSTDESCECVVGSMRACPGGSSTGTCVPGSQTCGDSGWMECVGSTGPSIESCNGADDDCNGGVDDGPAASSCGTPPSVTNVLCSAGSCLIDRCAASTEDCNDDFGDGCETTLGTVANCTACGDTCAWGCDVDGCADAVSIVGGVDFSCALRTNGRVACWGSNEFGELGDGTDIDRRYPRNIPGLTGVTAITAGRNHACAILADRTVRCWGLNTDGQLGNGSNTMSRVPVGVSRLSEVRFIQAGAFHTCAYDGTLRCWGRNMNGQLGNGDTMARNTPSQTVLSNVVQLAAGTAHTCGRLSTGGVRCWGLGTSGQLGHRMFASSLTPVEASGVTDAVDLTAGDFHTCVVRSGGTAMCWGRNNASQLGNSISSDTENRPRAVDGLANATRISAGSSHTCALRSTGAIGCWGSNSGGQLGTTTAGTQPMVTAVTDGSGVSLLASAALHTCFIREEAPWCFGNNSEGQLGIDSAVGTRNVPTRVVAPR